MDEAHAASKLLERIMLICALIVSIPFLIWVGMIQIESEALLTIFMLAWVACFMSYAMGHRNPDSMLADVGVLALMSACVMVGRFLRFVPAAKQTYLYILYRIVSG